MHVDHFHRSGYAILPAMLGATALGEVDTALYHTSADTPGARQMLAFGWCASLAGQLRLQLVAAGLIPSDFVSVQCTYFEKSRDHNWLVAPHQDLSIPVGARCAHPGLTGWSEKHGMLFVQPPAAVLEQLVALRLHIDECTCDDGALNVVPGSHLHGRLRDADKAQRRAASGVVRCPVAAGGGMVMRPLLLHASSKATGTSRRRVLHFLFGPPNLPYGLAWPQPAQQV